MCHIHEIERKQTVTVRREERTKYGMRESANPLFDLSTDFFRYISINFVYLKQKILLTTDLLQLRLFTPFFWEHANICSVNLWTPEIHLKRRRF